MLTPEHFGLFDKYKDAGAHAFSNGVVTDDDKDKYQQLFGSLLDAAGQSISGAQFSQWFKV